MHSKARMAGRFLGHKGYGLLILVGNENLQDTGIPCQSQSQQDSSIQLGNQDQGLPYHDGGIWLQLDKQCTKQQQTHQW
jgi:hypothetical protein